MLLAEGQEQAFRQFIDLYSPQVYTHLLRITRNKEVVKPIDPVTFVVIQTFTAYNACCMVWFY